MSENSPRLDLPYIQPSQAQKHVTHNEAIELLDVLTQMRLEDVEVDTPPSSPNDGQAWGVSSSPSGAWIGQAGAIASWRNNGWLFAQPIEGWVAWVGTQGRLYQFVGSTWTLLVANADLNNVSGLGINSTSDISNPLSVSGPASLFNHSGSSHLVKVNKAATPDTASVLFQTGFSGRAEIGLTATDDLTLKASTDGSNWNDVVTISPDKATVSQLLNLQPQSEPTIATAGDVYFDSLTSKLRCYDGSTWNDLF